MTLALRVGMGNSYGLRITVPSSADFDPTLPTAASLEITKPEGEHVVWPATILTQSASSAQVRYVFNADGSDLDQDGLWRVWVQWTVVGETPGPRSEVGSFNVVAADHI